MRKFAVGRQSLSVDLSEEALAELEALAKEDPAASTEELPPRSSEGGPPAVVELPVAGSYGGRDGVRNYVG